MAKEVFNDEAIEAAWNQSRRAHSLESMSATIHANAVQQALETQRAGERENVIVANSSFSNLWNSQVTPLINNLSNQWNNFTHNITTPSNFSGPLFNLPIVNGLTSFGSIIDNTLFNGQITRSTSQLNNTLESYPAYHAVNNALSFGMGATLQYINDMSFGLVDRFVNFENGNDAFQSGMEFGRTASTIYGAVEFVAGAAATAFFLSSIPPTGGATVACGATTAGLCLPIGGVALTAEAAGAVAGGVVMTHGIALEAYIANNPLQIRGSGGGSSSNSTRGSGVTDDEYEDLVRRESGGAQQIIDGREYDAVTNEAIIQAKNNDSAAENPINFLSNNRRDQIEETVKLATKSSKRAEFWFSREPHWIVRNFIEKLGGIVIVRKP